MSKFTDSEHCLSRTHCRVCRSDPNWRVMIGAPDECPYGVKGLGDIVEQLIKPVAKALNLPCLNEQKKLRPDSPCAKRRNFLNKISL